MGYFEGLISGFGERKATVEAENLRQAELANAREGKIFEALMASPDPDIRAAAVTGLLTSAQQPRRRGGLRGWMGEMEVNPAFEQIRGLIETPVTEEREIRGPQELTGYIPQPPPTTGQAALPAGSPVEPGMPQPTPITPDVRSGTGRGPVIAREKVTRPRQVFATPAELAAQQTEGQYGGRVTGILNAMEARGVEITPELAEQVAMELSGFSGGRAGSAPFQSVAGEMPDGTPAFGVFDRTTGTYNHPITGESLPGFQPRTATGSTSLGTDREALARELFGKPAARLTRPEMATVDQERIRRAEALSFSRGTGTGRAQIQTELASPIGITAGAAQGLDPTMTLNTLRGIIPITTEQRARLDAAQALAPQVATIKSLVEQVFPEQSRLGGVEASVVLGRKRAARDPQFAQLEAAVNLALGNVARVLAAEAGRLTEQDAQRARTALADLQGYTDTKESALAKLTLVDQVLRKIGQDIRTPAQQIQDRATQVGAPSPQVGAPPPPPTTTAAPQGGLDAQVPGWYVDDQGNLVQR